MWKVMVEEKAEDCGKDTSITQEKGVVTRIQREREGERTVQKGLLDRIWDQHQPWSQARGILP